MPFFVFMLSLLMLSSLHAKEVFLKEDIFKYLTLKNPSVYAALGKKYIYKEKEKYHLGSFDTVLALNYEKKDYPLSESEYFSSGLSKAVENGMEFNLAYRKAEGTQEYNNIKTGDQGEVILGVKVPIFAVAKDINKKKLAYASAKLQSQKMDYQTQDNMRHLYFETIVAYYKLLYFAEGLDLVTKLLDNAKSRETIIIKKVKVGSLARVSLIEAKQQIINRQQQLISAQNNYQNALETFTQYLNLKSSEFLDNFELPSMLVLKENHVKTQATIDEAIENRPDLKVFYYERKRLKLEEDFASISKYPELNLGVSAVHDFELNNGFKVTLDMEFPIERRKYTGKSLEIKQTLSYLNSQKEKKILGIKTKFITISNSIKALEENIKNADMEVGLVEELEAVENKKYTVGLSNLFMVNQREIYTLSIKKKFLTYNLKYLILEEELNNVVAKPMEDLLL